MSLMNPYSSLETNLRNLKGHKLRFYPFFFFFFFEQKKHLHGVIGNDQGSEHYCTDVSRGIAKSVVFIIDTLYL